MSRQKGGPVNADPQALLERWGVQIDPELLVLALTHRSFANEMGGLPQNERLEFLGDSVLSIIVSDCLFRQFPGKAESDLSKMRSATVSQKALAQTAVDLGLGDYILLGVGENRDGGREKPSILSDTLEALIGATYLSNGIESTRSVVLRALAPLLAEVEDLALTVDWRTRVQNHVNHSSLGAVQYHVVASGPDHDRRFVAQVLIEGQLQGTAVGTSKSEAENLAAREALLKLQGPAADPIAKSLA